MNTVTMESSLDDWNASFNAMPTKNATCAIKKGSKRIYRTDSIDHTIDINEDLNSFVPSVCGFQLSIDFQFKDYDTAKKKPFKRERQKLGKFKIRY